MPRIPWSAVETAVVAAVVARSMGVRYESLRSRGVPGCRSEVVEDCAEAFLPRIVVVVVAAGAVCGFVSGSSMRGCG